MLFRSMPDIMFQYRSAAFLGRLYCPEVILGLSTNDELQDMGEIVINPLPVKKQVAMPRAKDETVLRDIISGTNNEEAMADAIRRTHGVTQGEKDEPATENIDTQTGEITTDVKTANLDMPNLDFTHEADGHRPATKSQTPEPTKTAAPASGPPASTSMKNIARKKMENAALSDADFEKKFGKPFEEMVAGEVNDVLSWCSDPVGN